MGDAEPLDVYNQANTRASTAGSWQWDVDSWFVGRPVFWREQSRASYQRHKSWTTHHMDALAFLKSLETEKYDDVLFDPPYSITQAKTCYDGHGMELLDTKPTSMKYWGDCKSEIARITKSGGKVICFGWNSMGIGKNRGFEMTRVLLVAHGGSKNDTIVTVEVKNKTDGFLRGAMTCPTGAGC
jgi:hypothetical protein